jgi:Na+/H+ antiporter NhaC
MFVLPDLNALFFFNFSILSIIENTKTHDFLMDGVKKMPQEHSTVPLYLFSGLFLLELQACKSGKCLITGGIVQVEVEPCDVWKQQSQDVLVR